MLSQPGPSVLEPIVFSPSDFVAVVNQTFEYAYSQVTIVGELSNFRVSKGRWVYFDLKDDGASVKFFGTVYGLPGPLEEGMLVRVVGQPRLSAQYGFSVVFQSIAPVGEGALKRAADLLKQKLTKEGLFVLDRKRQLPYPPRRIGFIVSEQSAAYKDFMKILDERWRGIEVILADVQVQGDAAPSQIVAALEYFNQHETVDMVVVTRGGGSADDLAAFNAESVTRAVAVSRTPTMVAIGHEIDVSLAELAADVRASTPSNAAELLTPDRRTVLRRLHEVRQQIDDIVHQQHRRVVDELATRKHSMSTALEDSLTRAVVATQASRHVLELLDPTEVLRRGYALVRASGTVVKSSVGVSSGTMIDISLSDGTIQAEVQ